MFFNQQNSDFKERQHIPIVQISLYTQKSLQPVLEIQLSYETASQYAGQLLPVH